MQIDVVKCFKNEVNEKGKKMRIECYKLVITAFASMLWSVGNLEKMMDN